MCIIISWCQQEKHQKNNKKKEVWTEVELYTKLTYLITQKMSMMLNVEMWKVEVWGLWKCESVKSGSVRLWIVYNVYIWKCVDSKGGMESVNVWVQSEYCIKAGNNINTDEFCESKISNCDYFMLFGLDSIASVLAFPPLASIEGPSWQLNVSWHVLTDGHFAWIFCYTLDIHTFSPPYGCVCDE